jgi:hypothetical protein
VQTQTPTVIYMARPERRNGYGQGVAGLVLGILAIVFFALPPYIGTLLAVIGLPLAGVSHSKGVKGNRGAATAGIVLCVIPLAFWFLLGTVFAAVMLVSAIAG